MEVAGPSLALIVAALVLLGALLVAVAAGIIVATVNARRRRGHR